MSKNENERRIALLESHSCYFEGGYTAMIWSAPYQPSFALTPVESVRRNDIGMHDAYRFRIEDESKK